MIFLIESIILCLLFTAMVVPSVARHPITWISDYPPAIRERAKELKLIPQNQKKFSSAVIIRKLTASLLMVILLALALVYINGAETFPEGFVLSYGLWLIMDWYDALVLDCLWFCHSKKVMIPGTEDMQEAYRDYKFHIKMSCIGMLLGLPVCLLTGLGVYGINYLNIWIGT